MSDTSSKSGVPSRDNEVNETGNKQRSRKRHCWSRVGANICVGILALFTIILSIAIIYVFYEKYQAEQQLKIKTSKNSNKISSFISGKGIWNTFKNIWSSSSDDSETLYDDEEEKQLFDED